MSLEQAEFRRVLGHFASGITIVTTQHEEQLHGTTVSSLCSLSLEPALVLICIDLRATIHNLIRESGIFGVNILSEEGEALSRHFARCIPDKFSGVAYSLGMTGAPLLEGNLATLECRVVAQYPGGDHAIFVGEVVAVSTASHHQPLLYYRSQYNRLHSDTASLIRQK
jgi:flavin reductase (DIM6/NTAB) family NADH-FMN oxidoreductase RutF